MSEAQITIAGRTLEEWAIFARCDDCLDQMVPSDLRMLVASHRDADRKLAEVNARADAAETLALERAAALLDEQQILLIQAKLKDPAKNISVYSLLAGDIRALSPLPPLQAAMQVPEVRALVKAIARGPGLGQDMRRWNETVMKQATALAALPADDKGGEG
jgi:hypothetical protein